MSDHGIPIEIDRHPYFATQSQMTGSQLRALAQPPIGADRDLWEEVPGPADDIKVGNDQIVTLKPGMHFYTSPTTINPGESDATA